MEVECTLISWRIYQSRGVLDNQIKPMNHAKKLDKLLAHVKKACKKTEFLVETRFLKEGNYVYTKQYTERNLVVYFNLGRGVFRNGYGACGGFRLVGR